MTTGRKLAIGAAAIAAFSLLLCGGCAYYFLGREAVELGSWTGADESFEGDPIVAKTGNFIVLFTANPIGQSGSARVLLIDEDGGGHEVVSREIGDDVQRIYYPSFGPGTYRLKVEADGVAWSCLVKEWRR